MPLHIETFTGGIFDTNCFFLPATGILIDAPQDAAEWLEGAGYKVRHLLLTHGHIDHTWEAARITREHGCTVTCHAETVPMLTQKDFFKQRGFTWEVETLPAESLTLVGETDAPEPEYLGDYRTFLVPGHCPGSLCFLHQPEQVLFGGDVLFAGGVGRWDLPGGDKELLFRGIKEKLFALPDGVKVLPGHGPATTIGQEMKTNPFVGEQAEEW